MLKKANQNDESSSGGNTNQAAPRDKSGSALGDISDGDYESLLQEASTPLYQRCSNNQLLQKVINETDFKDPLCWPGGYGERGAGAGSGGGGHARRRRSRLDSYGSSAASRTTQGGSLQNLHGKLDGGGRKLHKSGSLTTFAPGGSEELEAIKSFLYRNSPTTNTTTSTGKTEVRTRTHSHHSDARDSASAGAADAVSSDGPRRGRDSERAGRTNRNLGGEEGASSSVSSQPPTSTITDSSVHRPWPTTTAMGCPVSVGPAGVVTATTTTTSSICGGASSVSRVRVAADDTFEVDAKVSIPLMPRSVPQSRCEVSDSGCSGDGVQPQQHSYNNENWPNDASVENLRMCGVEMSVVDGNNLGIGGRGGGGVVGGVGGGNPHLLSSVLVERARHGMTKNETVSGQGMCGFSRPLDENGNPLIIMQQESSLHHQQQNPKNANHYHQTTLQALNHHELDFSVGETPLHRQRRSKKTRSSNKQTEKRAEDIEGHVGSMEIDELVKLINSTDEHNEQESCTNPVDTIKKRASAKDREPNRPPLATRAKKGISGGGREVARKNLENDACSLNGTKETGGTSWTTRSGGPTPPSSRAVSILAGESGFNSVDAELPSGEPRQDPIAGWGMCATSGPTTSERTARTFIGRPPRKRSDSFTLGDGHRPSTVVVHMDRVRSPDEKQHQETAPSDVDRRPASPPPPSAPREAEGGRQAMRSRGVVAEVPVQDVQSLPSDDPNAPVSSFAADFYAVADVPPPVEEPEFCEVRKKKKKQQQQQRQAFAGRFSTNSGYYRTNRFYGNSYGGGTVSGGGIVTPNIGYSSSHDDGSGGAGPQGGRYGARPPSWNDLSLAPTHHHHHRGTRGGPEDIRRKSTSSVPPSEPSSADNSDVESVHSLPVSSTSPKQVVGKTSASSSCTPQASYADIAKMATSAAAAAAATRKSFGGPVSSSSSTNTSTSYGQQQPQSSSASTSPLPPLAIAIVEQNKRDACTSTHSDGCSDGQPDDMSSDVLSPVTKEPVFEMVAAAAAAMETVSKENDAVLTVPSSSRDDCTRDSVLADEPAPVQDVTETVVSESSPMALEKNVALADDRVSSLSDSAVIAVGRSSLSSMSPVSICGGSPAVCAGGGCCDDEHQEEVGGSVSFSDVTTSQDSATNLSLPSSIASSDAASRAGSAGIMRASGAASDGRTPSADSGLASVCSSEAVVIFVGMQEPADAETLTFGFEINEQLVRQTAHDMFITSTSLRADRSAVTAQPSAAAEERTAGADRAPSTVEGCRLAEEDDRKTKETVLTPLDASSPSGVRPTSAGDSSLDFGQTALRVEADAEAVMTRRERRLLDEEELHSFNYSNVVDYIWQVWGGFQDSQSEKGEDVSKGDAIAPSGSQKSKRSTIQLPSLDPCLPKTPLP